jgi:hypothetical protein
MKNLRESFSSIVATWQFSLQSVVRSPWFWLIVAGYLLHVLIMPVTGQHDVMFMPWMSHFINQGHLNLYSFLYENFGEVVMHRPGVWAPYPYGFYALTAVWLNLLDKAGAVNLAAWDSIWQVAYPARHVFLFKFPYLVFDLFIGYILYRTGGRVALALWAWSPAALYTPFMMGQNDIYATAFAAAGVYAASRSSRTSAQAQSVQICSLDKWAILSSILLGIGATFKSFPLFLLPPLAIVTGKNWKSRAFLMSLGCLVFGIFALPFITTPAYVQGVLLNPEATKIFRQIQFFGVSVAPFLVSYVILLGLLIARQDQLDSARDAWFISLATMALLFIWVPAPFYWLIWITPLLIGVVYKSRMFLLAWFMLQIAFAFIPLAEHRELGVALAIHLSDMFNVPNLPTTLEVAHPVLSQVFSSIWPLVNSFLLASLLLASWYALRALGRQYKHCSYSFKTIILGVMPTLLLLSGLAVNVYLARNLVSRNNYYSWEEHILSSPEDLLVQELEPLENKATGMRLRFTEASPGAVLKVCLYGSVDLDQEPMGCISKNASEQVENQVLYFLFDNTPFLESGNALAAKIQLETSGTTVALPYSTVNTERKLKFNNMDSTGTLDLSVLSPFSVREAFQSLVVENVLRDGLLLLLMGVTGALVFMFMAVLFSKTSHF